MGGSIVKELLRLQHIRFVDERGVRLEDLNLTVFAGETVCLLGVHGSGKSGVKRLLAGSPGIVSGTVYFHEQPSASTNRDDFARAGIQIINGFDALVGSMSISENLFLLRRRKGFKLFFNAPAARAETMQILAEFGIDCRAETRIDRLSYYEQYLLCIAKAVSYGARLLVLDLAYTAFSFQQTHALAQHIERLRSERDLSFLVLGDELEPLLEHANRVVILQDGRDVCTMYRDGFSMARMASYLSAISLLPEEADGMQAASGEHEGRARTWTICANGGALLHFAREEIVGLFDTMRNTGDDLDGYLRLLMQNSGFDIAHTEPDARADGGVVCVPENSADMLILALPIDENLLIPAHRRTARLGVFLSPAVMRYAVSDFYKCAQISGNPKRVDQLTRIQRKILSIHRWLLTRPRMLVLENPDAGLNLHDRANLYRYLSSVSADGTAVLVITRNMLNLQEHCDYMILAENGCIKSAFPRNSFTVDTFVLDTYSR